MSKKIAVILTGCGFMDGSEITESVSSFIALSEFKAEYQVFAPDQLHSIVDHLKGEAESAQRNVLSESARICRGKIKPLSKLDPAKFDGLVIPGGYGVAKVLSNWAEKGADAEIDSQFSKIVQEFHKMSSPIAAICISPALIAKILGSNSPELTIGNDSATKEQIEKTGATHIDCPVTDFITDRENKIITTPAYMFDEATPYEVSQGIRLAIKELVEMA